VTVHADGSFLALAGAQARVEVDREGKRKGIVRSFKVRTN
jgi:hypothetical protein